MKKSYENLKKQFEAEYEIINLKDYYMNWSGDVYVGIHTNEGEGILREKYKEVISEFEPFILVNDSIYEVICQNSAREAEREKKEKQRHNDCFGYQEGEFEKYHRAEIFEDLETQIIERMEIEEIIAEIGKLSAKQSSRSYKYFITNMTIEEIAVDEKVSVSMVWQSIRNARRQLQKKISLFGMPSGEFIDEQSSMC